MSSVMIAEYLDESEASDLGAKLKSSGINPYIKRHGLPRFFGPDSNYRIFIDRNDAEKAQKIAAIFKSEDTKKREELLLLLTKQCPRCQSARVAEVKKTSFLQKIRFFGVSVWQCSECGNEWYI
jgi:hypothetical protein